MEIIYEKTFQLDACNSLDNPLHRMRKFLESKGWWSEEEEEALKVSQKKEVLNALADVERQLKPSLSNLFTDVYDQEPWNLVSLVSYTSGSQSIISDLVPVRAACKAPGFAEQIRRCLGAMEERIAKIPE